MRNKLLIIICLTISVLSFTACTKEEEQKEAKKTPAILFKEDYEALNGKTNKSGKEHRTVNIDEKNPFMEVSASKILEMINNKKTFYVYFGSSLCPWCRSAIEKATEISKKMKINRIYYVDIWDEEGNEILRDKYELKDNKATKTQDGTEEYYKLLEAFKSVLSDYKLTNDKGKSVSTKEKRIYAPNYIYVKNGKAVKLVEGTSDKQKDSREELTEEMLQDEEKIFTEFFDN